MNPGEADKCVGDTTSAFSDTIRKKVGDADKSTWKVGKGVGNKAIHSFGRDVQSDKAFVSHSLNILTLYFITNFSFLLIG